MENARRILRTPPAQRRPRAQSFWIYLPKVLVYPLRAGAFSMITVLALLRLLDPLLGLVASSFIFGALFSAIVHFTIGLSLYRYAVQVLLDTSEGRLNPPEYSFGVDNYQATDQIKLQILLLGASVITFIFFGLKIGLLAAAALAIITPAATMSLALQRSLWIALNPLTWMRVMSGFGARYFAVVALCFGYALLQLLAVAFMPDSLPRIIAIPLFWWISHYAIVACFHAMGYLVLEHHEEIGHFATADIVLPKQRHQWDPDQPLLDEVTRRAERGDAVQAAQQLRQHLETRGGTQVAHDLYRQLITTQGDQEALNRHAVQYVGVLMAQGAQGKAVEMLQPCLDGTPDYCPGEIGDVQPLAQAASTAGKHELGVRVLLNGLKRFPKTREQPAIALLAARLLAEKSNDHEQARQLLIAVRTRFPEHAQIDDINRYLAYLDTLKA